jgi:hypothetical protein
MSFSAILDANGKIDDKYIPASGGGIPTLSEVLTQGNSTNGQSIIGQTNTCFLELGGSSSTLSGPTINLIKGVLGELNIGANIQTAVPNFILGIDALGNVSKSIIQTVPTLQEVLVSGNNTNGIAINAATGDLILTAVSGVLNIGINIPNVSPPFLLGVDNLGVVTKTTPPANPSNPINETALMNIAATSFTINYTTFSNMVNLSLPSFAYTNGATPVTAIGTTTYMPIAIRPIRDYDFITNVLYTPQSPNPPVYKLISVLIGSNGIITFYNIDQVTQFLPGETIQFPDNRCLTYPLV